MIHYSRLVGTLRFYPDSAGPTPFESMADYAAVCTVVWEDERTVYLHALSGTLTRQHQRELLDWLVRTGVRTVKAHRAPKHTLPLARRVGDHEEIDVADLVRRFQAPMPGPRRDDEDA